MLLLSIAGNCFAFPTKMRLLDIYIPEKLAQKFKGPKFGIPGVREILGVYDRPLTLQIIKPKMGMTPEETADQVYQSALGGADLCKDDEMCTELANCSFEARLEAVLKALKKAEAKTGHKTLYMVSITDEADRVQEKARKACEMGATGLLLAYSAGPSVLRVLAEDPKITAPILLHVSHLLAMLPTMNFPSLAKICRLCGADMMLTPSIWSSIPVASTEECLRTSQTLHAPFYHIKPIFPMPGAGDLPRRGAADAGGERPGHDLHGGRRHVGPPDGLHRRRDGLPPGDRRGDGRHPARRRGVGQTRADGRAQDLGPAQAPGHALGLLGRAVPSEVCGEGDLSRQVDK